jgi:hypothetical protein
MKPIWPKKSAMPSDWRTPIVAYHDRRPITDGIYQPDHVAD